MHVTEDGPDRQTTDPVGPVPGPEYDVALDLIPWETRAGDDLNATTIGPPEFELWMRTPPVDSVLAPALAAYATDLTLIGTALRPHDGLSQLGNGTQFTSAVTTHTLWFHRPFRTDEWLVLRQHTAHCWLVPGASAAATSSPTTAYWSRRTDKKRSCECRAEDPICPNTIQLLRSGSPGTARSARRDRALTKRRVQTLRSHCGVDTMGAAMTECCACAQHTQ
jgi:Acyl-CoA thioesterase